MADQNSKNSDKQKSNGSDDQKSNGSDDQKSGKIPIIEWIVGIVGLILVVGTIGFMMYKAFTSTHTPPNFTTRVERIDAVSSGYLVIFELKNAGDQTAAGVNVEGELKNGGETVEKSRVRFDYAPSDSDTEGGLFFKNDPRRFQMEIHAEGYAKP